MGFHQTALPSDSFARMGLIVAWFLFVVLLLCYSTPWQKMDSANYYLEGLLITKGFIPYLEFNDNKGPLLYYLLALPAAISDWNMFSGILLFRLIDLLIFYLMILVLRSVGYTRAVQSALMIFFVSAYAACFPFVDESIYSESPELLCRLVAILYYLKGANFRAGLFFGAGFLFRQTAIIDLLVVGVHQIAMLRPHSGEKQVLGLLLIRVISGFLIPLIAMGAIAWHQGWLIAFFDQALIWNYHFSASPPDLTNSALPDWLTIFFSARIFPLAILAMYWLVRGRWNSTGSVKGREKQKLEVLWGVALIGHLYESSASPLWYAHHLIPMLMILTIVAGAGMERMGSDLARALPRLQLFPLLTSIALGVALPTLYTQIDQAAKVQSSAQAAQSFSSWIASQTAPADRILVWGYAPHHYLEASRLPASRFHHNLFLTNQSRRFLPLNQEFVRAFRADIARMRPELIILENGSDTYEDLREFLPVVGTHYHPVAAEVAGKNRLVLKKIHVDRDIL